MVSPLQTGGQSQNLNSMTGSLERGNKGANCEGEKELSAKIKILQTKYKKLLKHDAVESQKIVYLRDINRTYEYLQLVEGKVSWSKVEETVDADQAAYEEECQDDWAIHDDLYDEEQEIFEQLQYHFEGFECPVEIVNARKARDAAHQALLDDVNQCLVSAPSADLSAKTKNEKCKKLWGKLHDIARRVRVQRRAYEKEYKKDNKNYLLKYIHDELSVLSIQQKMLVEEWHSIAPNQSFPPYHQFCSCKNPFVPHLDVVNGNECEMCFTWTKMYDNYKLKEWTNN